MISASIDGYACAAIPWLPTSSSSAAITSAIGTGGSVAGNHETDLDMATAFAQAPDGVLTGGEAAQRVEGHLRAPLSDLAHGCDDVSLAGIEHRLCPERTGQLECAL